ncbi:hypothetical protein H4582DRAFT_1922870 [Lactarius indigo]|nr:hypothetical protein H4582DRAFT_1922870 [Lactarius indigo]
MVLKGYNLNRQKIRSQFPRDELDTEVNYKSSYYESILAYVPDTAYKYVGYGAEPDGKINMVLVLEDGYDRKALDGILVTPDTLIT